MSVGGGGSDTELKLASISDDVIVNYQTVTGRAHRNVQGFTTRLLFI